MMLLKVFVFFSICRVRKMVSSRQHESIIIELGHTSYKLSQVLPDLAFREKSLSSSPKAPDLLTFGLEWDPGLTWGDFLFWLSRICRRIPTRSSSTWWFKATDVSIYLQQCVSANFLASVMMIIEHCEEYRSYPQTINNPAKSYFNELEKE